MRFGALGEDPGITPPGLGGGMPGEPRVTAAALVEALGGVDVVHWTLDAVGEGADPGAAILGNGQGMRLEVFVLPRERRAWACITSGGQRIGEMVADGPHVSEYFRESGQGDGEPEWSLSTVDPDSPDASWRLHTEIIEEIVGDRELRRTGVVDRGGVRAVTYEFSPDLHDPAGILVPMVLESVAASEVEISARMLVLEPEGLPDSIEVSVSGRTQDGKSVSARESYTFTYALTEAERAALNAVFEAARQRVAVGPQVLEPEDGIALAERTVLTLAKECPAVLDNHAALDAKLKRAERVPSAIGAWVLDATGAPLACWGEAELPDEAREAEELAPGEVVRIPTDGGLLLLTPYEGRAGQRGGRVVLRLARGEATP